MELEDDVEDVAAEGRKGLKETKTRRTTLLSDEDSD